VQDRLNAAPWYFRVCKVHDGGLHDRREAHPLPQENPKELITKPLFSQQIHQQVDQQQNLHIKQWVAPLLIFKA